MGKTLTEQTGWTLVLGLALLVAFAGPAHAYLDAGSGSYLFQLLIAGFVGALYAVKLFWKRIRAFFGGLLGGKRGQTDDR
jgi:hypothetical protein